MESAERWSASGKLITPLSNGAKLDDLSREELLDYAVSKGVLVSKTARKAAILRAIRGEE